MVAYTAQRLQTNAAWSAQFRFSSSSLEGWTLVGRAQSQKSSGKYVDLALGNQLDIDDADPNKLTVSLTAIEAATLGEGTIIFEIMRTAPSPKRPILRFSIKNHLGVSA